MLHEAERAVTVRPLQLRSISSVFQTSLCNSNCLSWMPILLLGFCWEGSNPHSYNYLLLVKTFVLVKTSLVKRFLLNPLGWQSGFFHLLLLPSSMAINSPVMSPAWHQENFTAHERGRSQLRNCGPQKDQTSKSWRKSTLTIHWKDWCWSWNSKTLATWCKELTRWKRPWGWERLRARGEGGDKGWGGWMASPTQWTWVWANFGTG